MLSDKILKQTLMTNEEIVSQFGDKQKIKIIRLSALNNAESSGERAVAVHMAKYGTY